MLNFKSKKAFTIIELIVVIAIIGILALFGLPRLIGYVNKAQLAKIQHDTKIMQYKMEEVLSRQDVKFNSWDNNTKDLGTLIMRKQLYESNGIANTLDKSHTKIPKYNWTNIDGQFYANLIRYEDIHGDAITLAQYEKVELEMGMGGPLLSEDDEDFGYRIVPEEYKAEIKTILKGTFYSNAQGKVYYESDKPLTGIKSTIAPNCVAPTLAEYDFEHITGTIVKYKGNTQYLIIPEAFLVEGKCWPVKIIGAGAFARNMPTIKKVVLPSGLTVIEKEAFEGNEIKSIIIPPGVTNIGPKAFAGNNLNSSGVIIQRSEGSVNVDSEAFGSANSVYRPSTNRDVGVIVKPNRDNNGNVIIGSGGRPTGSISGGWSSGGKVIVIPDVIVVDGVEVEITEIEQGAFQGEGFIHITMPSGLERIGDYAFAGNQLIGVNIPEKVNHVGSYAFAYNELYDGKGYKWTINYIDFKQEEQINKVNERVGNIEENGSKVNILEESSLLDYIWITSSYNFIIPAEYNPIIKGHREGSPSTPQINITEDSVTIDGGKGTEVRIGSGEWYDSPHNFTNLNEGSSYIVYSRYKETDSYYASEPSAGTSFHTMVTTPKEPEKIDMSEGTGIDLDTGAGTADGACGSTKYTTTSGIIITSSSPVYCNSNYYNMSNLFDGMLSNDSSYGDPHNYWLTQTSGNQILTFDFGKSTTITQIDVSPKTRKDHFTDFRIVASNDNVNWDVLTPWFITTINTSANHVEAYKINKTYQYYRFELIGKGAWGVSLAEVKFYQ